MKFERRSFLKGAAALTVTRWMPAQAQSAPLYVYVGCYTEPRPARKGQGIYVYRMDPSSGALTQVDITTDVINPSFLALDPQGRFLYAANEISNFEGKRTGSVSAYAIEPATGKLSLLNRQSADGSVTAHLSVHPAGRHLLVANYGGGTVAVLPIEADGKLGAATDVVKHAGNPGPNMGRQGDPHPHMILPDPSGRHVLATDLGLDKVMVYRLDTASGKLTPSDPPFAQTPPGAGPRHFSFHPSGRYVYVINELDSTLTAFAYDGERGALKELHTVSTLPKGWVGSNTTAQVVVAPSGKFVYGSNRGHDSIAIFAIDGKTGKVTLVGHESTQGQVPRNFNIDPSGKFLIAANQNTDNMVVFRINANSGKLTPTGHYVAAGAPVCVVFRM